MNEFANLETQNDVLRAINGDATSPVYSEGIRERRPADDWVGEGVYAEPSGNNLAFLIAAVAFAIGSVFLW